MNAYLLLCIESAISISLSCIILYALSLPLRNLLNRLCPDAQAADFWVSYTRVMLIIAPLLLVLILNSLQNFSNPLDSLRLTLIAALCGMLIGVHTLGKRLGQFVVKPANAEKIS